MKIYLFVIGFLFISIISSTQTQQEMNADAVKRYQKEDAKLNQVYKQLMNFLNTPEEKKLLIEAEKKWISFRDAHCAYIANMYQGGSVQPLIRYNCLEHISAERIKQLQDDIAERKKH